MRKMKYSTHFIEQPVTIKEYKIYDVAELPKVFLGIRVKNKFDERRLKIKSKYNPQLISHFTYQNELEPIYLYGIEIKPKQQFKKLLSLLNRPDVSTLNVPQDEFTRVYSETLKRFNLSCDTCYRYLTDGIYPIDVCNLDRISRKKFNKEIDTGFECMMEQKTDPWYLSLHNFNIFILGFSAGYSFDYQLNIANDK